VRFRHVRLILYGIIIKSKRPYKFLKFLRTRNPDEFRGDLKIFETTLRQCLDEDPTKRVSVTKCSLYFKQRILNNSVTNGNRNKLDVKKILLAPNSGV